VVSPIRKKTIVHTINRWVLVLFCMGHCMVTSATDEGRMTYVFDIPPLKVEQALSLLANQTGHQLLFSYELVDFLNSSAVSGIYTVEGALKRLLEGTHLTGRLTRRGVVIVTNVNAQKNTKTVGKKMKAKKNVLAAVIGFLAGGGGAQLGLSDELGSGGDSLLLEEVVVTGSREANRRAIAVKNDSMQIMDALSADDVGALPDLNIADAFRRLPGVNTQFDGDERRYVTVRGIAPSLNLVTIDGMAIGSSDENSSSVNMEAIPATSVSRLEVFKTQLPRFDGNAIGGTLNAVTRSAYDTDGIHFQVDAELSKYTFDDLPGGNDLGSNLGIAFSNTFGADDEFGLVLSAGYLEKDVDQLSTSYKRGVSEESEYGPISAIRHASTWASQSVWKRQNYAAKFEYQPNENLYVSLNNYYYNKKEDEATLAYSAYEQGGAAPTSATTFVAEEGYSRMATAFKGTETTTFGNHFHIEYSLEEMHRFSFDAAATSSEYRFPNEEWRFRTGRTADLGYTASDGGGFPEYIINNPDYLADADNFYYEDSKVELKKLDEDRTEIKFDYAYNADAGRLDGLGCDGRLEAPDHGARVRQGGSQKSNR
jgi:iron complex outermembrane recepter protein